jgi:hypothetical protein
MPLKASKMPLGLHEAWRYRVRLSLRVFFTPCGLFADLSLFFVTFWGNI